MASQEHADHDYIKARQHRYSEAWKSGSVDHLIEFFHKDDFIYSHLGKQTDTRFHSEVRDLFHRTFTDYHHMKIKTRSLHGHKHFTAWEWTISCKAAKGSDGQRLKTEEMASHKLVGCTLMWWDDEDKIVRSHEYAQMRDPGDEEEEDGFEKVETRASS